MVNQISERIFADKNSVIVNKFRIKKIIQVYFFAPFSLDEDTRGQTLKDMF